MVSIYSIERTEHSIEARHAAEIAVPSLQNLHVLPRLNIWTLRDSQAAQRPYLDTARFEFFRAGDLH